jgi:hypothetical protein
MDYLRIYHLSKKKGILKMNEWINYSTKHVLKWPRYNNASSYEVQLNFI